MITLALIILGLCLGSFINALVWRMREKQNKRSKYNAKDLSIVTGRSMCVHCGHVLDAKDLVPVLSWISLKGRCRYCHKPIPDTPFSEIVTPLLFVLSYIVWPFGWQAGGVTLFILWLLMIFGFVALCVYDFRWQILPDRIVAVVGSLVLLHLLTELIIRWDIHRLTGALWGIVFGAGIFWLIFQMSDGRMIGGGDVKLGVVYGLLLGGPVNSLLCIFLASLLGTLVALPSVVVGKSSRTTKIPFGPYLLAATIVVYLFGSSIVSWYRTIAGI